MSNKSPVCPVCESSELAPITYSDTFIHDGVELSVDGLEGYSCPECGADPILGGQVRRNHLRIADAKRRADGLLTGEEIRRLREHLHISQREASELFGGGANAFSKYERGDVIQSVPMDRLLRLVGRHPELMGELGGRAYSSEPPIYVPAGRPNRQESGWTTSPGSATYTMVEGLLLDAGASHVRASSRMVDEFRERDAVVVELRTWEKRAA